MTTKIRLQAMRFYAYHGVAEQERDRLEDTINYAEVYETVREEMRIPSRLLEHVAGRILKALHHRFPTLQAAEIKLSKLNPPFGGDLHSASVILGVDF